MAHSWRCKQAMHLTHLLHICTFVVTHATAHLPRHWRVCHSIDTENDAAAATVRVHRAPGGCRRLRADLHERDAVLAGHDPRGGTATGGPGHFAGQAGADVRRRPQLRPRPGRPTAGCRPAWGLHAAGVAGPDAGGHGPGVHHHPGWNTDDRPCACTCTGDDGWRPRWRQPGTPAGVRAGGSA
jgi:hypothetical protein